MNKLLATIGICVLAAGFTACTHKNNVLPSTTNPTITTNTPATGGWKVTEYTDRGVDETPDFSGYTFTFNSDGSFTATRASSSASGTWTRGTNDGLQQLTININSITDGHLAELNEDWVISMMTDNNINLADDSGHHTLKFQKAQ